MIDTWNDVPEDRPTFEKLVTSLVSLYQSTGGLDHHYHILNAPTDTLEGSNTACDPQYHVLEGPTANSMSGITCIQNEHHYAVLEGPTSNPETSPGT